MSTTPASLPPLPPLSLRSDTTSTHQSPSPSTTNTTASAPSASGAPTPPSTRKACDSCRLSKARCEPLTAAEAAGFGSDGSNICQRCAKTGRRCVFGERSRRQKRRRTGSGDDGDGDGDGGDRDKVSRLERKVSILEARLGTAMVTKSEDEDATDHIYHTPPTSSTAPATAPSTVQHKATTAPAAASGPPPPYTNPLVFFCPERLPKPAMSKPKPPPPLDVLARNILPLSTATALYTHFLSKMLPHFPFFTVPQSLAYCRQNKPILFLAILAVSAASSGLPELHSALLEEVYTTLAMRIIRGAEKSLELVQAIVITVTWYHPPATIEQSRLWMLTMQAASIAVDMNFGFSEDLDERRALLVCYSCNATISVVLRRPVFLRYGKRIQDAIDCLEASGLQSDKIITVYVTVVRFVEEAAGAAGILEGEHASPNTAGIGYLLDSFERRANEYRKQIAKTLETSPARTSVEIALHGAVLQVFSMVFEMPRGDSNFILRAQASLLKAAHGTIDVFLSCSRETLQSSPFHVFSRCANACSVLLRLAASLSSSNLAGPIPPFRSSPEARPTIAAGDGRLEHLRVPYYLSAMVDRLRTLLHAGAGSRSMVMSLALAEGMRQFYYSNIEAPTPVPAPAPEHEEGEALAAASILCGTPAGSYPPPPPQPQAQQPIHMYHPQPQPPPAQYGIATPPEPQQQQQQQWNAGGWVGAEWELSQEEIETFLQGIDGQIMMGGSGAGVPMEGLVGPVMWGQPAGTGHWNGGGWVPTQQQQQQQQQQQTGQWD